MNKVTIIGLGWLGIPLAQALIRRGWEVCGTKTRQDGILAAQRCGIDARPLITTPEIICEPADLEMLLTTDVLMITLPASRTGQGEEHYLQSVQNLVDSALAKSVKRILFTSSTSVYGDPEGEVTEKSPLHPVTASGQRLKHLEQWLHDLPGTGVEILRLAGLVGPDRHPGRFLAGKTAIPQGSHRVNLVHLDDVMEIICRMLEKPCSGGVFNICASQHPQRQHFYPFAARQMGLIPPKFLPDQTGQQGKIVNGDAICQWLDYRYQYPDPYMMPTS